MQLLLHLKMEMTAMLPCVDLAATVSALLQQQNFTATVTTFQASALSTPLRLPEPLSPGAGKGSPADPLLQRIPQEKLREVTDFDCHGCGIPST
jgi:hypothetical protein